MEDLSVYDCKFVYVKGEDNTMADTLSRYPSTHTTCNIIAQHNAQHPHIGFNKNAIVVLDRAPPTPTPLTSIAALAKTNPQKTKIEFSIDDDTVTKLRDGYRNDPWTLVPQIDISLSGYA